MATFKTAAVTAERGADVEQDPATGLVARNRELDWSFIAGLFLPAGWVVGRSDGSRTYRCCPCHRPVFGAPDKADGL